MATREELIADLTSTMQGCIEEHLQSNFEQGAQFSIDVAQKIAGQLETKLAESTETQINELKSLITSGDADIQPFIDFMSEMKSLLDGNDDEEGYQVLNALLADLKTVKELTESQGQTIEQMSNLLTTQTQTLADHTTKIADLRTDVDALKNATPVTGEADCEKCIDEMLELNAANWEAVCAAVKTSTEAFMTSRRTALLASLDPVEETSAGTSGAAGSI